MSKIGNCKILGHPISQRRPLFTQVTNIHMHLFLSFNPSNAKATFVESTRMQRFLKPSKPCHDGIHWTALIEYSEMSTHMPWFQ